VRKANYRITGYVLILEDAQKFMAGLPTLPDQKTLSLEHSIGNIYVVTNWSGTRTPVGREMYSSAIDSDQSAV
jgi:hypothetical protein